MGCSKKAERNMKSEILLVVDILPFSFFPFFACLFFRRAAEDP